jgi:colicin import membrane protein
MAKDDRQQPDRASGRWLAAGLAVAVHLVFLAVLVFSLTWQNKPSAPVTAELYAPPARTAEPAPTPPLATAPPPRPEPRVEPPPEPKAEPRPEPKPEPKPAPRPEPKAAAPDPKAADIALKARAEEEKRRRAQAEHEKELREQRDAAKREADKRAAEKKIADERRVAESRERQARETEALKAAADRERQVQAETAARAQAEANARAQAAARARAEADWIQRIQAKVKGNVILPPEIAGNPEAVFEVAQLPTGEIIDVVLRKSSGVRAYDEAVQRALAKSSPLPRPERAEVFQRTLTLRFRPQD